MLRAMSAILVAFLVLCGGIALKHALAGSPALVAVFDGVSAEDLASENIVLLDAHPSAAIVSRWAVPSKRCSQNPESSSRGHNLFASN